VTLHLCVQCFLMLPSPLPLVLIQYTHFVTCTWRHVCLFCGVVSVIRSLYVEEMRTLLGKQVLLPSVLLNVLEALKLP
jgi:hypothetical protein